MRLNCLKYVAHHTGLDFIERREERGDKKK